MKTYNVFHRFICSDDFVDINYDNLFDWVMISIQYGNLADTLKSKTYAFIGTERVFVEQVSLSNDQIYIIKITADPIRPKPNEVLWSISLFITDTNLGTQCSLTLVNPDNQNYAFTFDRVIISSLIADFFPSVKHSWPSVWIRKGLGATLYFPPKGFYPTIIKPTLFEAQQRAIDAVLSGKPVALAMFEQTDKVCPPIPLVPIEALRHWAPAEFDFDNYKSPPRRLNWNFAYCFDIKKAQEIIDLFVKRRSKAFSIDIKNKKKTRSRLKPTPQAVCTNPQQPPVAIEVKPAPTVKAQPLSKIKSKFKVKKDIQSAKFPLSAPSVENTKPVIAVNTATLWEAREEAKIAEALALEAQVNEEQKRIETIESLEALVQTQAEEIDKLKEALKIEAQRRLEAESKATSLEVAVNQQKGEMLLERGDWLLRLMIDETQPVSVLEALELIKSFSKDVVVLPSALASAKEVSNHSVVGRRLLNLLVRLVQDWRIIYRDRGDNEARQVFTPSEYAAQESETVLKGAMMAQREFLFGNENIVMTKHLKIGSSNDIRFTIRVYFEYNRDEDKVVIGYCGRHLNIASV